MIAEYDRAISEGRMWRNSILSASACINTPQKPFGNSVLPSTAGNSNPCYDSNYFKQHIQECQQALAKAWSDNRRYGSTASYEHYKKLDAAATGAGANLTFVSQVGGSGSSNNGGVDKLNPVATVDEHGNIISTRAADPNKQASTANPARVKELMDTYHIDREAAEALAVSQPTGAVSQATLDRHASMYNYGTGSERDNLNTLKGEVTKHHDANVGKRTTTTNAEAAYASAKKNGTFGSDYVKQLKEERRDARQNERQGLRDERKAQRKYDRAEARNSKEVAKDNELLEIGKKNTAGYGGQYGAADVATTQGLNMAGQMLAQTMEQGLTSVVNNKNTAVQMALSSKGTTATVADTMKAQVEAMKNGAKSIGTMQTTTEAKAVGEAYLAARHLRSQRKVDQAAARNAQEVQLLRNTANGNTYALEEANAREYYAGINSKEEKKAQRRAAAEQMMVVANTSLKAAQLRAEKKNALAAAQAMNDYATATSNQGYTFTPGGSNNNGGGDTPNNNPDNPGGITSTDNGEQGITPSDDLFNPNMGDGGLGDGPAPGQFIAGDPNKGGAGGGGPGNLAAGSTSAAKDDSKGESVTPGKNQAGGSFAANEEGSGSRFSRGGGGGGDADSSWLEMMKKFLPGGDEVAKLEDRVDLSDRSIASDQPSVLGRNKNIFEEISKKYQKKSVEGAVVFRGENS